MLIAVVMIEQKRKLLIAPAQTRSSVFITKESWAISLPDRNAPVSFQYK
jgi:hypothetical protein